VVAFGLQTLDALGNVASDYAGTVRVTSDDTQATLPANVTLTSGTASAVQITFNTTGTHTVTATDTTTASITGTASTSVSSSGAPTVALSGVTDGQKVSGKVALTATGTQALGTTLTRLEIYVDGTSLASSGTSPLSAEWDTAGLPANSTHVITATATDADGPSATTAPVTVTVGGGGCGCSSAGGADVGALLALGAAVRRLTLRRRRAAK